MSDATTELCVGALGGVVGSVVGIIAVMASPFSGTADLAADEPPMAVEMVPMPEALDPMDQRIEDLGEGWTVSHSALRPINEPLHPSGRAPAHSLGPGGLYGSRARERARRGRALARA